MSMPPRNASPTPADVGVVAVPPLAAPRDKENACDDPSDIRERNPKRQKTSAPVSVSLLTIVRNRICAKFGVEMGSNVRDTLELMS